MIMKTDHLWIFYNSDYADFCHRDNVGKLLELNTTTKLQVNTSESCTGVNQA